MAPETVSRPFLGRPGVFRNSGYESSSAVGLFKQQDDLAVATLLGALEGSPPVAVLQPTIRTLAQEKHDDFTVPGPRTRNEGGLAEVNTIGIGRRTSREKYFSFCEITSRAGRDQGLVEEELLPN